MVDYLYEKHRARKEYQCAMGDGPIQPGEEYYAATIAGGGIGAVKYPARIHIRCKGKHQDRARR